jgi:hypothetical protein
VRYKRNQLTRQHKAQRKRGMKNDHSTINQFNDGLLHYAPYRVVLAPSKRFYETLCVAEQGRVGDPDHQEPVYHSVIPNQVTRDYDNRNVFPNGNQSKIIIGDFYCYSSVDLPFEAKPQHQFFMIRRVLIKYSSDFFHTQQTVLAVYPTRIISNHASRFLMKNGKMLISRTG